ncbi:MAG: hypothetical protein AB1813_10935 [Verrucomicrobiota bacterium]
MTEFFFKALAVYLGCGIIFAIPFVWIGAGRIDPQAAQGTWGFRAMIFPGAVLLWPLLALRCISGAVHPPEEHNAHRRLAQLPSPELHSSRQ